MTERRSSLGNATYSLAGSSFLAWLNESSKLPSGPSNVGGGAKSGGPDEDARSWAGFERRRHAIALPREPVAMKGPAFWSKAATVQKKRERAQRFKGSQLHVPFVDCSICPRLRKLVYVLVAVALALFFILICLVSAYIKVANNMDAFLLRLGGQEQRLVEAVRSLARYQNLNCQPCWINWMQMGDACYLFTMERMSWQTCVDYCKANKGSLLTGQSEGEMISLMLETRKRFTFRNKKLVSARYWIGLKYNHTASTWLWADGAHMHIKTPVAKKLPPLFEDACVQLHNGHEDIRKCQNKYQCLCKTEAS